MTEYQINALIQLIDKGWLTEEQAATLVRTWDEWTTEADAADVIANVELMFLLTKKDNSPLIP